MISEINFIEKFPVNSFFEGNKIMFFWKFQSVFEKQYMIRLSVEAAKVGLWVLTY
jgi:hypothetical protein